MLIRPFDIARLPRIVFGQGTFPRLPELARTFGTKALLVTGARSLQDSPYWEALLAGLKARNMGWEVIRVAGEPSPQLVDEAVSSHRDGQWDVVIGIGGGSALDAAKAIAGLLIPGNSVLDHLEGVGPELPYTGPAVPFIAVPTTAGTGSEATKNAVLSTQGPDGYKKSFRDEKLVAAYALVDPDLLASCPKAVLAANGMDAFTQLMEAYVSIRANPMTDALARSGLEAARDGLLPWYEGTDDPAACRSRMAYAALLSGIVLAQTGLGSVHGLASPLGAYFPIPHGVVCGTLVAAATRVNVAALVARDAASPALGKYADIGRLLSREPLDDEEAIAALISQLEDWTRRLDLPRLSAYGIRTQDFARIVANSRGSSMQTNPVVLTDEELEEILSARI
jgi:alcohol dehydrogenase